MYFAIAHLTPLNNYVLHLEFRNGEKKIFDMKPYLETGVLKELKDEMFLKLQKWALTRLSGGIKLILILKLCIIKAYFVRKQSIEWRTDD